jgi:hypothetical protein
MVVRRRLLDTRVWRPLMGCMVAALIESNEVNRLIHELE